MNLRSIAHFARSSLRVALAAGCTAVTEEAGIDFRYTFGDYTYGNILQSSGSGVTVFDYDGDGDLDLFLANYGPNVFPRNDGDGIFSDVTDSLGLRGPETLNGFASWSVGGAFWDYDYDGDLDLMVGNFLAFDPSYVSPTTPQMMPHPSEYHGQPSLLYRQGPDVRFADVTREAGLFYPESKCMGLTVFDYDDDGDLDLFQGNDHQLNFLFRNDGDGAFREVAQASGVAANDHGLATGSMHGSIGDVDGEGLIDLFVTDLRYGSLYRNLGGGVLVDVTRETGLAGALAGKGAWAAALFDFDNDRPTDQKASQKDPQMLAARGGRHP
jgi:hypothetical protein